MVVKLGNDRSAGLQLLSNPFNDWSRLAEHFSLQRNQTKLGNLALGLTAEHEVKRRSDRVVAIIALRKLGLKRSL